MILSLKHDLNFISFTLLAQLYICILYNGTTPTVPFRLRCLEPFQMARDGWTIPLPTRKTIALLVYLLLHPEAHAREQLCTLFWGDFADKEAQRSLRTALSALRKALGPTCLVADRELVQFNPAYGIWVDALRFRMQAQRLLTQSVLEPTLIDLALYQGELLDGFYDDWILREREELRLLYLQVLLRLAQHWRVQGDYVQLTKIAQQILTIDPAEEIAHQHLLFCYTTSSDRQAARQQYEACVRVLRAELDVEPSPETVALYRRSQQPTIRPQWSAAAQSNLPLPLASFIGRVQEITRLKAILLGDPAAGEHQPARLVTVTGSGGCGKTRLVMQVARELLDFYPDGIWWVELGALSEPTQVAQAIAKVLDVQQGVQPSLIDVLITNLRSRQALLVLDNCEHLVTACAELAECLLSHCPALQILNTSREVLGILGEISWLVPSLTLPRAQAHLPAELLQYEAIRLFVERASAVQRDFALTPENAPAILQICRQLDGIPLAIELAAARVKLMTAEQLAIRLTSVIGARFDLLTDGSRTVLPRQQTLRATMAWSYALLNEQEQQLLQQFAIFAGGWSLEAAEATGVGRGDQPAVSILARLLDKSLVLAEPQGDVARYQMLETIRQYALEQLEKSGEMAVARDRHLAYFLQLAEQAEPEFRGAGQLTWLRRLAMEYENLRIALTWGLQHEHREPTRLLYGATLATTLIFYWKLHSDWLEGRYWLEMTAQILDNLVAIIDAGQAHQVSFLRAKALYGAGVLVWHQGTMDESSRLFDSSAKFWRAVDDYTGLFRTQIYQAQLLSQQENLATAYTLWDECLIYFRQVHDTWYIAETIFFMGWAARRGSNFFAATRYYNEAMVLLRSLDERWLFSLTLSHLGLIAWAHGDYATARQQIEQRLIMGREFGLKQHIYTALNFLAPIIYEQGDLRQATQFLREALIVERQAGIDLLPSFLDKLVTIALGCAVEGRGERAIRLLAAYRSFTSISKPEEMEKYDAQEELLAKLHTQLGAQTFATTWAEGAALTPEQSLREALAEDSRFSEK